MSVGPVRLRIGMMSIGEVAEAVFVASRSPDGHEEWSDFCAAQRLVRAASSAEGSSLRVPEVVLISDREVRLDERIGMGGMTRGVLHRSFRRPSTGKGTFDLDGKPPERYYRWFASADGRYGAVAFAHDRTWKTSVLVFEEGAESGGLLRVVDDPAPRVELESSFGSFESVWGETLVGPTRARVWSCWFPVQPLGPLGIEAIDVAGAGVDASPLMPTRELQTSSLDLDDLLQHGDPELVQLEFGELNPATPNVMIAVRIDPQPGDATIVDKVARVVQRWVDRWTTEAVSPMALQIDPANPLNVLTASGTTTQIAAIYDLCAHLTPAARQTSKHITVAVDAS